MLSNKTILLTIIIGALLVLSQQAEVLAETFKSNTCVTKIGGGEPGNPKSLQPGCDQDSGENPGNGTPPVSLTGVVCPIPNGSITCGPSLPSGAGNAYSCNHCGKGYPTPNAPWCIPPTGAHYAVDIAAPAGSPVYIPELSPPGASETHPVESCKFVNEFPGTADPSQSIMQYRCIDSVDKLTVWFQFHHSRPGSGLGSAGSEGYASGMIGARVASNGDHTHVQIAIGVNACSGGDQSNCVAASNYLQCN